MKILNAIFLMMFSSLAQAQDIGFTLGLRADSGTPANGSYTISGQNAVTFGSIIKSSISEKLALRYGLQYTTRQFQIEQSNQNQLNKFTYFEVPVGLLYQLNEFGGLFFGPSLGLGLEKNCGAGVNCLGVNSSYVALQIGASFKFAPQMGLEVFYESGLSALAQNIQSPRAVGLNLLVTFD